MNIHYFCDIDSNSSKRFTKPRNDFSQKCARSSALRSLSRRLILKGVDLQAIWNECYGLSMFWVSTASGKYDSGLRR